MLRKAQMVVVLFLCGGMLACGGASANDAGADGSDGGGDTDGGCEGFTFSLTIEPSTITRGQAGLIVLRWVVSDQLNDATALLTVGGESVEIDVPLVELSPPAPPADSTGVTYEGSLQNPLGLGVPLGEGQVLASGTSYDGCATAPTASTSFFVQ